MDNIIITYAIKASIGLALFYGLYTLCMKGDTFLKLRRFYFLFAIVFSLSFPFFALELSGDAATQLPSYWLSEIEIGAKPTEITAQAPVNKTIVILSLLGSISIILILRFATQLLSIARLKAKNEIQSLGNYKIVRLKDKDASPFSFFNWIFIDTTQNDEKIQEIIAHEKAHAQQYHSVDVLLIELVCICFWWNPVVWLIRRDMKINLEYLADKGVLEQGFDSRTYQYILLQVSNKNTGITLINNFNVSQLKKRITMMNKGKSSIILSAKYWLAIPIGAALLLGNAVQATSNLANLYSVGTITEAPQDVKVKELKEGKSTDKDTPFLAVDQMPRFVGGEQAMFKFVGENLKYPMEAQKAGIEGRVVVRFVVDKEGKIKDVSVIRSLDLSCDKETVRMVKSMPNWTPGKQNGQAVDVYYTLPIVFKLKGSDKKESANKDDESTGNEIIAIGYGNTSK